jgi:hypothetical protein
MQQPRPPNPTQVFWLRGQVSWCTKVPSSTGDIRCSPLTARKPGRVYSHNPDSSSNSPTSQHASKQVSTPVSPTFPPPMPPPTALPQPHTANNSRR